MSKNGDGVGGGGGGGDVVDKRPDDNKKPNLSGDLMNFIVLMVLFVLQGVTFGITMSALPIILQSKKTITYDDQALFSIAQWPNSMKLFWAPIVDAFYFPWIGRRKTWLHPIQYLEGTILIYSSYHIHSWLPETGQQDVVSLTIVFIILNILSSTEMIAIDGWTLTILRKVNVGYSSASSSSGFAIGVLLGSVVPVLITSEDFSNKYFRITPGTGGIISLKEFFFTWGIMIIVVTTLICIFKKEKEHESEENHVRLSIVQNYKLLWNILKLPDIRVLLLALATMKVGFSAMRTSLANLKLIDAGVPKDDLMVLNIAMFAVKILTPLIISKYTSGPKPMSIYFKTSPVRLLWSLMYIVLIHYTPTMIFDNEIINVPFYYYLILGFINSINEGLSYIMLVAVTAFFTRISDPRFGGTYMTMLFTISNTGMIFSSSLGLEALDYLTFEKCSNDHRNDCSALDLKNTCRINGGKCTVTVDGYYVEIIVCLVIGFVWYGVFKNTLKRFQKKDSSEWAVRNNEPNRQDIELPNAGDSK